MSPAYYAYLAMKDRQWEATLRKVGCFASADHVGRRADEYERRAGTKTETAPLGAVGFGEDGDLSTTTSYKDLSAGG